MNLRLTQPLKREFGREVNFAPIRIARKTREIAHHELEAILLQTISEVLNTYLDLIYITEELKVRHSEVQAFQLLIDGIDERLEKGMSTLRQRASAMARKLESIDLEYAAKERFVERKARLYELLGLGYKIMDGTQITPVGTFSESVEHQERDALIASTLKRSPELLRYLKEWERDKLELLLAEDQAKPTFNLIANVGLQGLDESPLKSFSSAYERQTFTSEFGVVYSRPFGNDQAEARIREVKKRKRQTELEVMRVKHQAVARVLRLSEILKVQQERHANARALRYMMENEVNSEELLIEKGEKSTYETIQFYNDLYDARIREINTLLELNRTKSNLWFANGSLLDRLGILYLKN